MLKVETIIKTCKFCKKEFEVPRYKKTQIYCSLRCKYCGCDSSHLLKYCQKRGESAKNKGKKHPEMAQRMRTGIYLKCDFCKKEIYVAKWRLNRTKLHFCSQSCNNRYRTGVRGRNYINGSSFELYPEEFNEKLKAKIRNRDENLCILCEISNEEHKLKYNKKLTIHHIDYNKENCSEDNLITLCLKHNSKVNEKKFRKSWMWTFKNIIFLSRGIILEDTLEEQQMLYNLENY